MDGRDRNRTAAGASGSTEAKLQHGIDGLSAAAITADTLQLLQGERRSHDPETLLRAVRCKVDLLVGHIENLPAVTHGHIEALEETLLGLESSPPQNEHALAVARLELTQRVVQLGQSLFSLSFR